MVAPQARQGCRPVGFPGDVREDLHQDDIMNAPSIEQTKTIYRAAIDASASDGEGEAWWREVQEEVVRLLAARTVGDAAAVIDWWHIDWAMVNDTPRAAAKRLREAARPVLGEIARVKR